MKRRVWFTTDGICSYCDGDKYIGGGRTCPNCNGTGLEPVNEDRDSLPDGPVPGEAQERAAKDYASKGGR